MGAGQSWDIHEWEGKGARQRRFSSASGTQHNKHERNARKKNWAQHMPFISGSGTQLACFVAAEEGRGNARGYVRPELSHSKDPQDNSMFDHACPALLSPATAHRVLRHHSNLGTQRTLRVVRQAAS